MEVRHYLTAGGIDPVQEWLDGLEDMKTRSVLLRRMDRLRRGNLGDCRFCSDGVWELRIDCGPGYRIYYAMHSAVVVLLLGGGTKRTQTGDIFRAIGHWRDFQRREHDP